MTTVTLNTSGESTVSTGGENSDKDVCLCPDGSTSDTCDNTLKQNVATPGKDLLKPDCLLPQ